MSILADFFIAHPDVIWNLHDELDYRQFPHVQAGRIDVIKIATLDKILTQEPDQVPDPFRQSSDGDISVVPIRQVVITELADLSDDDLPQVAAAWAATEEWQLDGGTADDLAEWLLQVRALAQQAQATGMQMFVWVCV